jgi:hypothetical protein
MTHSDTFATRKVSPWALPGAGGLKAAKSGAWPVATLRFFGCRLSAAFWQSSAIRTSGHDGQKWLVG